MSYETCWPELVSAFILSYVSYDNAMFLSFSLPSQLWCQPVKLFCQMNGYPNMWVYYKRIFWWKARLSQFEIWNYFCGRYNLEVLLHWQLVKWCNIFNHIIYTYALNLKTAQQRENKLLDYKMGKGSEKILLWRRYTNGQEIYENMVIITCH